MFRTFIALPLIAATILSSGCLNGGFLMKASDCPEGQTRTGGSLCVPVTAESSKLGGSACEDIDLAVVKAGTQVKMCDGSVGVGTLGLCTEDGQSSCINEGDFKAVKASNVEPGDIRHGKTIAGITGNKREMKQCRNAADLAFHHDASGLANLSMESVGITANVTNVDLATDELNFNPSTLHLKNDLPVSLMTYGTLPGGLNAGTTYYVIVSGSKIKLAEAAGGAAINLNGSVGSSTMFLQPAANSVADVWDTIDDFNNNRPSAPTATPGWSSTYVCDASNFSNLSSSSSPGLIPSNVTPAGASANFSQIWRDELTGLYFTNILYDGSGSLHWAGAMQMCLDLNSGDGAGNWRLPTQKELLQLYVDGISRLVVDGGAWADRMLWSATIPSHPGTDNTVWTVDVARGGANELASRQTTGLGAICVR